MDTNLALLRKARDYLAMDSRRRDMAKAVEAATDLLLKLSVAGTGTVAAMTIPTGCSKEIDAFLKAVK